MSQLLIISYGLQKQKKPCKKSMFYNADLALNSLRSYTREKLGGHTFVTLSQFATEGFGSRKLKQRV
jgi:hypothetical protein